MEKVTIKSKKEINKLKKGGDILVEALLKMVELAKTAEKGEKISTWELNELAEKIIKENNAEPSFLNYPSGDIPFPASACISLNNEIVHGIPKRNVFLKKGDLVSLDLGVKFKGLYTDAAVTIIIGKGDSKRREIKDITRRSLELGLEQLYPGSTLGNFGNAVEKYVNLKGYHVVKGLVGHGVGYAVHEPPQIPNFGSPGKGMVLQEGMVVALEPMVNEFSSEIKIDFDGSTYITKKGGISAHFECTVAITKNGHQILTNWFDKI